MLHIEGGVDYNMIFLPNVKYSTIRAMLASVTQFYWELEQLDLKITVLHGKLHEQIFMNRSEGFKDKIRPDHVCFIKRFLYRLKQSPR